MNLFEHSKRRNEYICTELVHKNNGMLVISSREFRQNQKAYFEKADNGEQIIVQRSKNKAYALTPIKDDDVYYNAQMREKIAQSMQEVKEGKVTRVETHEDISRLLGL